MNKIFILVFGLVAMFSFSGCTTKLAYDQKYTADLKDLSKVKDDSKTIYICKSDSSFAMNANHMIYDSRTYIMEDNIPQSILKDYLSQYFSKIEELNCNRNNFNKIEKEPLILVYGNDAGISISGASFFVENKIIIKNKTLSEKLTERKYVSGMEANLVEFHNVFTSDTRLVIAANRSIFKAFENEKSFFIENLK